MNTPVTHGQMIKMFSQQQDAILEITRLNAKAINAKTVMETDRIDMKLDGVITRQDKVNNSVAKNVREISKNTEVAKRIKCFTRHWRWCLIGLFVFCYGVAWMYENINLKEFIINIIGKL